MDIADVELKAGIWSTPVSHVGFVNKFRIYIMGIAYFLAFYYMLFFKYNLYTMWYLDQLKRVMCADYV